MWTYQFLWLHQVQQANPVLDVALNKEFKAVIDQLSTEYMGKNIKSFLNGNKTASVWQQSVRCQWKQLHVRSSDIIIPMKGS